MTNENSKGELPRYKLLEPAYINEILYDGKVKDEDHYGIVQTGANVVPGPHMEPLNDAARRQAAKMTVGKHPINDLPMLGNGDADEAQNRLVAALVTALTKANPQQAAPAAVASLSAEEIEDRVQEAVAAERNRLQAEFDAKIDELTAPKEEDKLAEAAE